MRPIKELPKEEQCPFNRYVKCMLKDNCPKCGWNPKVTEERMKVLFSGGKF